MHSLTRFIRREWEMVLLAVSLAALTATLLAWALAEPGTGAADGGGRVPAHASPFTAGAFDFLTPAPALPSLERNPFGFRYEPPRRAPRPEPRPEPRPRPQPPPPRVEPVPAPAVEPPPAGTAPPPVRPPSPTPRLGTADLTFVFSTTSQSGRPVAMVELLNPARPGAQPLAQSVGAGDVFMGLKVDSLTDAALNLVDAGGRRHRIPFGATRRVAIRVEDGN